jgi:hypothetical protein
MNNCLTNYRNFVAMAFLGLSIAGSNFAKAENSAHGKCEVGSGFVDIWKTTEGATGHYTVKIKNPGRSSDILFQELSCEKSQANQETRLLCKGSYYNRPGNLILVSTPNHYYLEWVNDASAGGQRTKMQEGNRSCNLEGLLAGLGGKTDADGATATELTSKITTPATEGKATPSEVTSEKGILDRSMEKLDAAKSYLKDKLNQLSTPSSTASKAATEAPKDETHKCTHRGGKGECSGVNFILSPRSEGKADSSNDGAAGNQ